MSLVLDTGTMKYRENPNQPWRPLVIKAGMNWESMADTYDPDNGTYEVGQYVLEEGMMYRCISEITTPETWTPAHWTSVNVGNELSSFIIISDDQPTEETNKIWIAETTSPFGVQVPTMDDHIEVKNTLNQLETNVGKILPVITGTTNNSGYTIGVGDYFEANGTLYQNKTSAAIPIGGTWSGTEVSETAINNLQHAVSKNSFGSIVSLLDYVNPNYYVAPEDGYVYCNIAEGNDGLVCINSTSIVMGGKPGRYTCFVRKGMHIFCTSVPTTFNYAPLTSIQ